MTKSDVFFTFKKVSKNDVFLTWELIPKNWCYKTQKQGILYSNVKVTLYIYI